ncbi:Trehalose-6-P synthase/phosphatase complex synthase subunit [Exophiala xenobiotica]|nr:Trehalose-6-P synthase/phosphatase complex synthase subunit [Exophiala xenobiotica]KAK5333976.1 Trehalose-6-P synthase/phosphatase complex synthase subunit [Exophiala xenobiotica]
MDTPPATPESVTPPTLSYGQRLIVVSNRLPVTLKQNDEGKYDFNESSGGLASGMSGVKRDVEMLWYGWPGMELPPSEEADITRTLRGKHSAVPVPVDDDLAELYYNGFSNSTLWPLLHYQPNAIRFHQNEWQAYLEVNQCFADKLAEEVDDGDIVWVHDYHLMLLPTMLSEAAHKKGKHVMIGFFLHTPFPTGDMFKALPHWEELIEGLLRCSLIGFHTQTYAQNFKRMCGDYLGFNQFPAGIERGGNFINLGVYPIGIDVPKFVDHMQKPEMHDRIQKFRSQYKASKLIIGVDRLDYIKGIPQKLNAMELFLDRHPDLVGEVTMIQVAVPSRENVKDYKDLADELHRQVDRLNGKHGSDGYLPIHFLHQSVPFDELMTMYAASDICFVSSIRDGMNLVSYEYVATQRARRGVLLLSEFAGAAEVLKGSVPFNPWDMGGTAEALHSALTMGPHKRAVNHRESEKYVMENSSAAWGKSFVSDLQKASARYPSSISHSHEIDYHASKMSWKANPSPDCGPIWRRGSILLRRETS